MVATTNSFLINLEGDNCKYGIGVSSGGAALEIIFKSLNIKDKEVIVPTNTFVATSNAVSFAGGKIKFADISKKDIGFESDFNKVSIFYKNNSEEKLPKMRKSSLANEIVNRIISQLN